MILLDGKEVKLKVKDQEKESYWNDSIKNE